MKQEFLKNIPKPILLKLSKINLDVPSQNCQVEIDELLSKSVLLGGKRLRPLLCYLFADFFGVTLENAEVNARAIEMVHAASLAHDDVIDDATQRRGNPSINIQSSNKKAVLAGDYLLAAVIGELTRQGNLRLVSEMAWVIEELDSGEWIQSDAVLTRKYTEEILDQIASKKTSSVMSWCATSGAILSGGSDELVSACKGFGYHLGLAFQLLDDTLDFSADSQKDALLDLKNGQINSVLYQWLKLNPSIKNDYESGQDISELFNESFLGEAIAIVEKTAKDHLHECDLLLFKMLGLLEAKQDEKTLQSKLAPIKFILNYLEARKS
jgi:geranylgeranyl pyrophosphate synthase